MKLFSAIAGVALVLAAVLFLRYSMQQGWLQPPVRVLIGIAVAVGLLVLCELKAARQYPATANALDAAAIAILFATFFAAHALWNLIPALLTFALLAAVTALAVLLSIRRASLFIAVLGLVGGFATPALLSTGENRPIPLFAYIALLNVGLAWVAYRQLWPSLTILTLVLTTLYQWVWVAKFLSASELPLAFGIFALFPVVSVAALMFGRRGRRREAAGDEAFERTAMISAVLPLIFAAYIATVPAYGAHPGLLFGFLFLLDVALLAISLALGRPVLHALGAVATLVIWGAWSTKVYPAASGLLALLLVGLFVALYALAPTIADRVKRRLPGPAAHAVYAAPAVLFVFPMLLWQDWAQAPWLPFGLLLAMVLLCAWRAIGLARGWVFFVASFMAVAAQASWSTSHLGHAPLWSAVIVYAVFGLITTAVPIVARRMGRPLEPRGGSGVVLIASLGLLLFLARGPIAPTALWALALLLAILNAGLFIESATSRTPILSQVGGLLSWAILALWWTEAAGAVGVLPSIAVVTGLSLVMLGGHAWAFTAVLRGGDGRAAPSGGDRAATFGHGLYLGLIGHLFLLFLATNRSWALPPWPVFGALAVMTLAASVVALFVRNAALHVTALAAASVVLTGWTATAGVMPWTVIGIAASGVLSAAALAFMAAGRRAGAGGMGAAGLAAALFGGQAVAVAALLTQLRSLDYGVPREQLVTLFLPFFAANVVNVAGLLALTFVRRWRQVAAWTLAAAWLAVFEWQIAPPLAGDWVKLLLLAGTLYAVFTANALMAGPRLPERREPWLVALGAAVMAFFAARAAFEHGGLDWMVGVVPVVLGLVTALLLRALLRLEAGGPRDMTRLALVAGAALAFVTVAIPLQLDHQWITIGWALEGAALAWLYRRVPHRGLLAACGVLLAAVFVRLALNPSVWTYEPRGELRILNWYLYTYLLSAAAMLVAARWLWTTTDQIGGGLPRVSRLLPAAAGILLFLLLNIEIADFYATGPEIVFRFGATVSQDLTYTIGWLAFGMILLAVGIYMAARPARITAVALIAVTTFKCFLYDLSSLEGLYRIASFVGLAFALALVSLALQKYVLARPKGTGTA